MSDRVAPRHGGASDIAPSWRYSPDVGRRGHDSEVEVFFDLSLDLLAIAGDRGRLDRVNASWQRVLGWTEAELTSTPFIDFIHPDDRERTLAEAKAVYAGHPTPGFRNRYRARDGRYHWLEWNTRVVADGRLYCSVRDVTREHEAAAELVESAGRFRALAEGSIQGIVVEDVPAGFRPLFVNDAAARMFGYASATDVMALPSLAHLAPPASLEQARQGWDALAAGHVPSLQGRVEMRHRDGRALWVELMCTVIVWDRAPALQMTLVDATERVRLELRLEELATTDALTGLPNRRQFTELAARELLRADRVERPLSLLVIDADHFKAINDRHGHVAGDEVLRTLGRVLRDTVRVTDLICRWGGEELVVLLPDTDLDQAAEVAERIRRACADSVTRHGDVAIPVTVSIGVAARAADEHVLEAILDRADQAMYAAKSAGRNTIRTAR